MKGGGVAMEIREGLRQTLMKLCENEGLTLAEKRYANKHVLCITKRGKMVINTNYHKFPRAGGGQ